MSELDVKKKIFSLQVKKYKQYGYHSTGQTKESAESFESLMGALNKIKTDLVSLSIVLEKADQLDDSKNVGTTSEFRDVLNHALDAKKQLKQSTFKTFLPTEIDQIKEVYGVMEEFITTLGEYSTDKITREQYNDNLLSEELSQLQVDLAQAEMDGDDFEIDFIQNELVDLEEARQESYKRVAFLQSITAGQQFPLYKRTIEELLSLMKNKVLRNEGDVSQYAKTLGGSNTYYNWIHAHQGTEYI
jgi:hypothetical protein